MQMHFSALEKTTAAIVLILAAFGALLALGTTAKWVGHTDVEVCFVIVDGKGSRPVPHAVVHVRNTGEGLCDDREPQEFTIEADAHGRAKRLCKGCMCGGSQGVLEDSFSVSLPGWWFHASASGYFDSPTELLCVPEYCRSAQRGELRATVSIPIRLQTAR